MKETNTEIAILIGQADNCLQVLEQNRQLYFGFKGNELQSLGRSTISAMVFSQIYVDFYTCVETFLFRVSQTFENSLSSKQWHKDLLEN